MIHLLIPLAKGTVVGIAKAYIDSDGRTGGVSDLDDIPSVAVSGSPEGRIPESG